MVGRLLAGTSKMSAFTNLSSSARASVIRFPRLACAFPQYLEQAVPEPSSSSRETPSECAISAEEESNNDDGGDVEQFLSVAEEICSEKSTVLWVKERIIQKRSSTELTITRELHTTINQSKKPKLMPNYFLAIPISSPEIHAAAEKVQNGILNCDKKFQPAMIPLPTLHVTLLVMRLESSDDVAKASATLEAALPHLRALFQPPTPLNLTFRGLQHFRSQILFIRPVENESLASLRRLADTLTDMFTANGIPSTDSKRDFKPHLTLMKLSKAAKLRKSGLKLIDPGVYDEHNELAFGTESVRKVQLLSMLMPKDKVTGYYHCCNEVDLFDG